MSHFSKILKCLMVFVGFLLIQSSNHPIIEASFAAELPSANPAFVFQLSYDDAEAAIGKALADKGAGTKIAATINGDHSQALFSYKQPLTVEIRGLTFEKPSRWSANLLFVSEGQVVSAIPVAGRFEEMVSVPVLKHEVRNGDVIGEQDVELRDFPVTRTRTDTIINVSDIIGKSPAFSISPGRPVRLHEIANPAIVKKNGIVTMRYTSPGMEITTTGQAMEEGAKGDTIDVKNTVSRKIIRAVIADENTVVIPNAGEPYAAN